MHKVSDIGNPYITLWINPFSVFTRLDQIQILLLSVFDVAGARCVAIRGPNIRGDFDELEQVLRQYSNIQKPTKITELNLKQYHGMSWPPED